MIGEMGPEARPTEALLPPRSETAGRIDARALLRILAAVTLIASLLTLFTVALPREARTGSNLSVPIALALATAGGTMLLVSRRSRAVAPWMVHLSAALFALIVLFRTSEGMDQLGGIQAVFLVIVVSFSASVGSMFGALAVFAFCSGGFALALSMSDAQTGLNMTAQLVLVTFALLLALVFHRLVRRRLEETALHEQRVLEEQATQRAAYAGRLEELNRELHEANELKGRFVAMASHELRTPLTAISGFAVTMRERWDELRDEDKQHFLAIIDEQAARLGRLVSDLLTLARIEEGRLHARLVPVDVREQAEAIAHQLGLDETDIVGDATAIADPDHLQQLLVNFLGNAVAHGAPPFEVRIGQVDGFVEIRVCDHGPGVPPEFVPRLFERFTRGPEAAANQSGGGTGLGLSIVDGIAEALGGSAFYEPNEPRGACFGVRLRAAD